MCRSVGCILAELLYRKPLFPGKDYIHQLKLIIKTLGSPSDEDLEFISIPKARAFLKSQAPTQVRLFRVHILGSTHSWCPLLCTQKLNSWGLHARWSPACQLMQTRVPAGC